MLVSVTMLVELCGWSKSLPRFLSPLFNITLHDNMTLTEISADNSPRVGSDDFK